MSSSEDECSDIVRYLSSRGVPSVPIPPSRAGSDDTASRHYIVARHLKHLRRQLVRAYVRDMLPDIHPDLGESRAVIETIERALSRSRIADVRSASSSGREWVASGEYVARLLDGPPRAFRVAPDDAEDVCRLAVLGMRGWLGCPGRRQRAVEHFRAAGIDGAASCRLADLVAPSAIVALVLDAHRAAVSKLLGEGWEEDLARSVRLA